jgi:truncated hemoglobin YjbI
MSAYNYPNFRTENGYLTETIRQKYLTNAIAHKRVPANAHRIAALVSLTASNDTSQPIQFWQLYSVLGPERIVALIENFYTRVYRDETWFSSVFSRLGDLQQHVGTQSSMWIDVMGGGQAYHGGEYRLSFHHTHNAIQLMNDRGAQRWVKLMLETLNDPSIDLTDDARVRPSINTFLGHFMSKYAAEFKFNDKAAFGVGNGSVKRKINFMTMSSEAIEALSEAELIEALTARGVDVSRYGTKVALVNKALML